MELVQRITTPRFLCPARYLLLESYADEAGT